MQNRSFAIGPHTISPGLVLAPMSGVTNRAFRRLILECNPNAIGLTVTEFVSVEGLTRNNSRSLQMIGRAEEEKLFCVQVFGYDIERMRDAAIMVEESGADILDINCGCPAPKVVRKGGGCELMRQPKHLRSILREVKRAVSIPVTVKMRSGWDDSSCNALEVARVCEEEGAAAITIHGRTRVALYRGVADWNVVRAVAQQVTIPVCGSGDVTGPEALVERFTPDLAGVYVGRAAMSNPFVFLHLCGIAGNSREEARSRLVKVLQRYGSLLLEEMPVAAVAGRLKQLASQFGKGLPWVKPFCRASSFAQQLDILHSVEEVEASLHTSVERVLEVR